MLVMLSDKHTRNACLFSNPSDHMAKGVPSQNTLTRTPLWLTMMKVFPRGNAPRTPNRPAGTILDNYPCLLLGHHPMVTSLLNRSKVIFQPMKDGNGERTSKLGPIITMSCHPWDSNAKNKTHQIPPNKTHPFNVCLARKPRRNPLLAQVEPNEPPIPGPSPSSEPPEDVATHEPEPDVAPTQSMEEPFARPATPRSIIIIDDTPFGSSLPFLLP
ncbi:hypothetical protein O181_045131 [Austropuccinia psidii MF-1]|uniref:Uncharacterized protein n=1 Tax=Austropuccinia psidii MF-1 TaxID=1389203 RepID=A0A9Q3DRR2_9BASI|nr:hypothetical protein [Austropuccinia psidii MF-1]